LIGDNVKDNVNFMISFLKKIDIYLQVKLLNKIDSRVWKFSKDEFDAYLLYKRYDKDLVNKFYPHIDADGLKDDKPEDIFLMEQFMAYVYKFEQKMMVEPLYGWAIPGKFEVFKRSFPYVSDIWDKNKRKPSLVNYLLPKKVIEIDSCIPIRYYWQNYYHFFIDTLSQVYIAKDKVPADVPILVPYFFNEIKYVTEFLKESDFLSGRKIIVQKKDEYYSVKNLFLCKDTFYSDSIFEVVTSFGDMAHREKGEGRKIFLKRSKDRLRAIINTEEIEQAAAAAGFEIKDAEGMSLKEQVLLFANTASIIGIHGAGLTNIIFRDRKPLKVLEIFPADTRPDHYRHICTMFNYGYDCIYGSNREMNHNERFYLDPNLFKEKLSAFAG